MPDLRIRREGCKLVALQNSFLVVLGGWNGKHNIPEIEIRNLEDDEEWKIIDIQMDSPWEYLGAIEYDYKLYIWGG